MARSKFFLAFFPTLASLVLATAACLGAAARSPLFAADLTVCSPGDFAAFQEIAARLVGVPIGGPARVEAIRSSNDETRAMLRFARFIAHTDQHALVLPDYPGGVGVESPGHNSFPSRPELQDYAPPG